MTRAVLTACALLVASACTRQPSPPERLTYALPITVAAIPAYVALDRGLWKAEGLEVTAQMFSAGRLALDSLLAGNADVMSVSETPLMHAILQGNRIFIVATVAEHREVKALARVDHGIKSGSDFRGKRVATLPGTNSDYFMYEFLRSNRVPPYAVRITNMAPPEMVTAFVRGDIDAYFAWEPHVYYGKSQVKDAAMVFEADALYQGRHSVAMNQRFVQEHPDVVEKLIRGFLSAERFVVEHPQEAIKIVAKRTGMEQSALTALWPEYTTRVRLDSTLVEVLQKEGRWAREQAGSTEPLPDFRAFIYTEALSKVQPSAVDLGLPK